MEPERKTIEEWKQKKGTADWLFAGAEQLRHQISGGPSYRWAKGQEVTEAEYDAAIEQVAGMKAGY